MPFPNLQNFRQISVLHVRQRAHNSSKTKARNLFLKLCWCNPTTANASKVANTEKSAEQQEKEHNETQICP